MQVKAAFFSVTSAFHSLLLWFGTHVNFFSKDLSLGSNTGLLSIFINVNAIQFSQVTESPQTTLKVISKVQIICEPEIVNTEPTDKT